MEYCTTKLVNKWATCTCKIIICFDVKIYNIILYYYIFYNIIII